MPLIEEVVRLPAGEGLAGILTHSSDLVSADHPAALLLDVGLTYRVGPSRLHVRLARQLATSGIPTLRFDFSGNGDSPHRSDALAFAESAPLETTKAMDWLSQRLGVQRFLLLGICSGARVAFRTACQDDRVAGIAMLNVRSLEENTYSDARTFALAHESLQVLRQKSRWKRVLTGQTNYRSAFRNLARAAVQVGFGRSAIQEASHVAQTFRGLADRGVAVCVIFSTGEFGRRYLRLALGSEFDSLMAHPHVAEVIIPFSDHTFTWPQGQDVLLESIGQWSSSVGTGL